MDNHDSVELRWVVSVIRRRAWLIAGCTVAAAVLAFGLMSRITPSYTTSTTLLVLPARDAITNEYSSIVAGQALAATYSLMLEERPILEAAITRLGLQETPDALATRIAVGPIKDTQLIRLSVTDASPTRAALVANTIADEFTVHLQALQEARYQDAIAAMEARVTEQSKLVHATSEQANSLSSANAANDAELVQLAGLLDEYRSDHRTLQQAVHAQQQSAAQLTDGIFKLDKARASQPKAPWAAGASVALLVRQSGGSPNDEYLAILANERLTATYTELVARPGVLEAAIAALHAEESADSLAERVTVEQVPNTTLIELTVMDDKPEMAIQFADAIADAFIKQTKGLQQVADTRQLADQQNEVSRLASLVESTRARSDTLTAEKLRKAAELAQVQGLLGEYSTQYQASQQAAQQLRLIATQAVGSVVVAESAKVPASPVQNRMLYMLLATAITAAAVLGIVFLREYLDDTVKTNEDIAELLGLNSFGSIGRIATREAGIVSATHPESSVAGAFQMLAANIRLCGLSKSLRTLVVTSPNSGEGKSVVAANLAVALAQAGLKVVVIDANLRQPRLEQMFGAGGQPGFSDALLEGCADGYLRATTVEGVKVLAVGLAAVDPVLAFSSSHLKGLLHNLASLADIVVIDTSPVLPVADARILAAEADGVLMVLQPNKTGKKSALSAIQNLRLAGVHLVGAVLNAAPDTHSRRNQQLGARVAPQTPRRLNVG